jgi:hypothetical protein
MEIIIPIKVIDDADGNSIGFSEYRPDDTIGLEHGGTGSTNLTDAKVNLELAAVATTASYSDLNTKPMVNINRYDITTAASVWVVNHNKNTTSFQSELFDSENNRFFAKTVKTSDNTFTVFLTETISGHVEVVFNGETLYNQSSI